MNKNNIVADSLSRRQFLGRSALTGAAAFVPSGLYDQVASRKIRLGIAGGRFGLQF